MASCHWASSSSCVLPPHFASHMLKPSKSQTRSKIYLSLYKYGTSPTPHDKSGAKVKAQTCSVWLAIKLLWRWSLVADMTATFRVCLVNETGRRYLRQMKSFMEKEHAGLCLQFLCISLIQITDEWLEEKQGQALWQKPVSIKRHQAAVTGVTEDTWHVPQ